MSEVAGHDRRRVNCTRVTFLAPGSRCQDRAESLLTSQRIVRSPPRPARLAPRVLGQRISQRIQQYAFHFAGCRSLRSAISSRVNCCNQFRRRSLNARRSSWPGAFQTDEPDGRARPTAKPLRCRPRPLQQFHYLSHAVPPRLYLSQNHGCVLPAQPKLLDMIVVIPGASRAVLGT